MTADCCNTIERSHLPVRIVVMRVLAPVLGRKHDVGQAIVKDVLLRPADFAA